VAEAQTAPLTPATLEVAGVCATERDDDAAAGWGVEGAQEGDGHDASQSRRE